MRIADRANLFKTVSDNFRRRQHSGIDFVLVRIIRTDSGDESSGSNVFLVNEKFFRGRTGHNDIAGSESTRQSANRFHVDIKFARARLYWEAQHWQEAGYAFRDIGLSYTNDDAALSAAQLYLEALNILATTLEPNKPICLEDMAKDVDDHIDWIETQMDTIKQVGLENYLAEQIKKES